MKLTRQNYMDCIAAIEDIIVENEGCYVAPTCCALQKKMKNNEIDSNISKYFVSFYQSIFGILHQEHSFRDVFEDLVERHPTNEEISEIRLNALSLFHAILVAKINKKASGF